MADRTTAGYFSRLSTRIEESDTRSQLAGAALLVFIIAGTLAGFAICVAAGFGALSLSSLVAAYLLGASE